MLTGIRAAALTGYAGLARSVGLDPEALLAEVGLEPGDLAVPDRWIPGAAAARLLELSAARSGCADFGLRLAGLRGLGTLGPISVVLRDEPDLGSALELLIRYQRVYNEALRMQLRSDAGTATLVTWLEFGERVPTVQALDLLMGAVMGIVRALVRGDWQPLSVQFAHPVPADPEPYQRVFGSRLRFDHEFTGLTFPARDLTAPLLTSDASVRPYSQQFLSAIVVPRDPSVRVHAADVVELLLPLGRCSLEEVSRHLGLGPRQLQRALAEESSSFSDVVHLTRARLAERYLTTGRRSLTEVSQLLGFAAPSAFSRWFRERFGASPSAWRAATAGVTPVEIPRPRGVPAEDPAG